MANPKARAGKNKIDELCDTACPVRRSLDVLDGKWTILVLRDLMGGPQRFGELRRSLGQVNPKTLTQRLRHLEKHKVISKKIYPVIPPKVEYRLTEKGARLKNVIKTLAQWGAENL